MGFGSYGFGRGSGGGGGGGGGVTSGTYAITDAMVRCTGQKVSKTIGGTACKLHDGGAIIEGIGQGSVTFKLITCTPSVNPQGYRSTELFVDGQWLQSLVTTVDNTTQDFTVDLGAGLHRWELWEANNYDPNPANTTFTCLQSVTGAVAITAGRVPPSLYVAGWGDSMMGGVALNVPWTGGIGGHVRAGLNTGWVSINGIGGRKSSSDTANNIAAGIAASVTGGTTRKCVILMGFNDYNGNVAAATYQTNMAAIFDAIHAADSAMTVLAIGALPAATETANGAGSTLGDFRTACSAASSGRAWVTYQNGQSWISTSDLIDGIHPSAAASATVAGHILAWILG